MTASRFVDTREYQGTSQAVRMHLIASALEAIGEELCERHAQAHEAAANGGDPDPARHARQELEALVGEWQAFMDAANGAAPAPEETLGKCLGLAVRYESRRDNAKAAQLWRRVADEHATTGHYRDLCNRQAQRAEAIAAKLRKGEME